MKEKLEQLISELLQNTYDIKRDILLTQPPTKDLGDFSTNIAFVISKQLNKKPLDIAEEISKQIESKGFKAEAIAPGFVNIFLNRTDFLQSLLNEISTNKGNYISSKLGEGLSLSVEHTAANPNKHLHIGHLRNFSIADTLVRVMKKAGYEVTVQWLNNDQGLQVAKVIWGITHKDIISVNYDSYSRYDTYAAEVYVKTEKYLSLHPELEDEVKVIIKNMEEGNNEISNIALEVTQNIIKGQLNTIQKFRVTYNEIISESDMTQSHEVERIINELKATGKIVYETEGKNKDCVVIKGLKDENDNELEEKVLLRSNGTAVYTAKDIVIHLWKFGLLDVQFNFIPFYKQWNGKEIYITSNKTNSIKINEKADIHINVVDQRQKYPLQVVKESLSILGYEKSSKNLHHLAYETVALSKSTAEILGFDTNSESNIVAMSGRKGIEVSINYLLDLMIDKILKRDELMSYEDAEKIASGALRYYMIKYGYNTIIILDIEDAIKADGDTGVYLMYAYVRAKSILSRANVKVSEAPKIPEDIDETIFNLFSILSFSKDKIIEVSKTFEVSKLAEFAFQVAKSFTAFYQNVNVLKEADTEKKDFYIYLIETFISVYSEILDVIGIYPVEKM